MKHQKPTKNEDEKKQDLKRQVAALRILLDSAQKNEQKKKATD